MMEKAKLLIDELAALTGVELALVDNLCELTVEDRMVLLRYRPEDNDWLYFGMLTDGDEAPSRSVLENALALNLFGSGTFGLHIGLFGQSLILSGTAPMEGLTAEVLAEKLLFLARQIVIISESLGEESTSEAISEGEYTPFNSGFLQV